MDRKPSAVPPERVFEIKASGGLSLEDTTRKVLESEVPGQIRAMLESGYFYFMIDVE